jgi:hypothetical protein
MRPPIYWQIGKWGIAAVLSMGGIAALVNWQVRSYQYANYWGLAGERVAGLASIDPSSVSVRPAAISERMVTAIEPETSEQGASGAMIVQTLSLKFVSAGVTEKKPKIDDVIRRFHGYIDSLTIQSDIGAPHSLSATVRIPAEQLQSALVELKTLGSLTEESENSQDTTAGYTDLVARLSNARRTEQRLLALLTERAGKLGEVVEVEKEIGAVRERIERMEAQQRRIENQVQFASVKLEVTEESHARGESVVSRLRTAFGAGYRDAGENTLIVALVLLHYGPTFVAWFLIVLPFVITFYRWRRLKRIVA